MEISKYLIRLVFAGLGKYLSPIVYIINRPYKKAISLFLSGYYSIRFKSCGKNYNMYDNFERVFGEKYITIGDNVTFVGRCILTAIDKYNVLNDNSIETRRFSPIISIGDGTQIGEFNHITSTNSVIIGRNVLTGPFVLITDNAHGYFDKEILNIAPFMRELTSKGGVVIKDNVWIGEGAQILPGVTIGEGSIIASNSVVTHNVPPYCLVSGVPAKIIKSIQSFNQIEKL